MVRKNECTIALKLQKMPDLPTALPLASNSQWAGPKKTELLNDERETL
jgi:hypothetical protein